MMDFLQIIPTKDMKVRVRGTLWIPYHKCTNCWSSGHQRSWAHTWRNCLCLATAPVLLSERSEFVVPNSSSNEEGPIADYPLKWNYTLCQLALMLHLVSGDPRETTWDKTRRFVVISCSKFFKVCVNYSNFCQLYQLASTSWSADVLSGWTFCQEDVLSGLP